ncbi:TIGR03960 family B12-binding radical SAM protein [Anaerofustis sp. NSJ-163]|uniref:TIGR03960 family B12-binding radical SAM protein n=1 Tax=Anaerofustis sp. NSJ-163 TaxID=2944391 RepID=UPI00209C5A59|nr:TIGR03960 family B12-binding radical SAM protein [Anaerofustis sp. NSJ-163]MCO8194468.1 TIGR03960 family B12-binding radical SAM protein [Anaerofustis sp. NSJ-163]
MKDLKNYLFENILPYVEKPSRYIGDEFNSEKPKENPAVRFAFCFPDIYEIGMSHLGMKILYEVLNNMDDVMCERVFAPNMDMVNLMREHNFPLYTLESFSKVSDCDFVGFTIQFEMCLTTVLLMLDLAGIPFLAKDRTEDDPLVVCGGPCTCNPEPFADFFDLMMLGEGEEVLPHLMELYKNSSSKKDFLIKASEVTGVYIPNLEEIKQEKVEKSIIESMNNVYTIKKPVVPYTPAVHDRITLEVMRGCFRGCRFCQAGMIYRPVRQKSLENLQKEAKALIENTGYEEMSLSSLSTTDHFHCMDLIKHLVSTYKDKKVNISLPSLRMDQFSLELSEELGNQKKGSLTFAPEAGSQRMRNIINKNLTEEEILSTIKQVFETGYSKIKLYFMIGLPYETDEDIKGIADLAQKIIDVYYSIDKKKRAKPFKLTVSTSCFVPKPFTAFQWFPQNTMEEFHRKQQYLKSVMPKQVTYNYHDSKLSMLEAVLAKGDRSLSQAIINAYNNGCVFDSWFDHFNYEGWIKALKDMGIDAQEYASRKLTYEDELPWDKFDYHVDKEFLIRENEKAKKETTTPPCHKQCSACGISKAYGRCKFEV